MSAPAPTRLRCGVFLPLGGLDWPTLRARAQRIEELGYDGLWLDDHFWFPGAPERDHLEVWTALTGLACSTRRMTLGPLVLCQSFRHPGLLAKMAATLSHVAEGRLVLALGAGWMEEEYRAYGYAFPKPSERLEQLAETLEIVTRLARDGRATFRGRHHSLEDAPSLPTARRLPIVLGGASDRLLRLAARHADGWNCPNLAWRELAAKRVALTAHCQAIGRDPAAIEVSEQVLVVVARNEAELGRERERARRAIGAFANLEEDVHMGTPERVAASLLARRSLGVEALMVMFGDFGSPEQIELFASEVLPRLRDA